MRRARTKAGRRSSAVAVAALRPEDSRSHLLALWLVVTVGLALLFTLGAFAGKAQAVSHDEEELSFLRHINEYRKAHGLGTLLLSDQLSLTAERHGSDMGKYAFFSHVSERSDWYPAGSEFWKRLELDGYAGGESGENLAAGMATGAEVFAAWKASPSHNENMLDPGDLRYRQIGVARVYVSGSPYGWYWATEFGSTVDKTARDPFAASAAVPFPDVAANHPYAEAIEALSEQEVISGYTDGNFGPGKPVLRQQFAKMIVGTLGLPVSEADVAPFEDVSVSGPGALYPDNFIAVAATRGITNGTAPGRFSPVANISRAQVVTMIVRAAQEAGAGLGSPPAVYRGSWADFSDTHARNAALAQYNGLLDSLPVSSLDPWGSMPRGEVAQILHNLQGRLAK